MFAFVFALAAAGPVAAALDPLSIPAPRPSGWVIDRAGVLSAEQVAALNQLGDAVHARDGATIAIATVPTTGGAEHRAFATRLFNHWGLGQAARDNGLLVFVAVDDRAAEIVLGTGIDSDAGVRKSDRVMGEVMLPRFREGRAAEAIVAGARACARDFFGVVAEAPPNPAEMAVERDSSDRAVVSPTERPRKNRATASWHTPATVLGGGGLSVAAWIALRRGLRRRPRRCRHCSMTMVRLDEAADDAHLSATEAVEERLGSVDYDVWLCPGCGAVDKVRHGRWFTRYSRCGTCGAVTRSKAQKTLVHATTVSTGIVEVHESCAGCGFSRTYTQTTPRIPRASSSGRSSGSGGGRSAGRGSSGRW